MEYKLKRPIDAGVSALALVALAPVIGAIAVVIRARLGSPVFFRQQRPGVGGRAFTLVKFRTMRHPAPNESPTGNDRARLTPFGAFLRRTSLDEVPELWNVLRGDMSLVGPRPLLSRYLPYYTPLESARHTVRPGITGWAQVNGRNTVSWSDRLAMDVWYVDHQSLWLDLRILARTLTSVFRRSGVVTVPGELMQDLDVERGAVADAARG